MKIYQRRYGGEYHTLYLKENGHIVCECLANMFDPLRDINCKCRHAKDLRAALAKGDLSKYSDVTPKK